MLGVKSNIFFALVISAILLLTGLMVLSGLCSGVKFELFASSNKSSNAFSEVSL